jgi:hypothetical protein
MTFSAMVWHRCETEIGLRSRRSQVRILWGAPENSDLVEVAKGHWAPRVPERPRWAPPPKPVMVVPAGTPLEIGRCGRVAG